MTVRRPLVLVNGQRKQLPTGDTLAGVVQDTDPRLTDAREWTATTVTQTEAEQGTATTRRAWTAQRVFQAIAAWWATSTAKTKLDGIQAGATANATNAQLRDRTTHTGTQAISTVSGLQAALDTKLNTTERGVSGGVATLDEFARIPSSQLPSYVDDVLEFPTRDDFPATGEGGKIYIAVNQGTQANPTRQYRWTGSVYAEINPSPGTTDALAEGSTNRYFSEHRVRNTVLTGLSLLSSAAITATDTVLSAFGKIQARLNLLGTAANANVQTSKTDTTADALMVVGAGGLLNQVPLAITTEWYGNRFRGWSNTAPDAPVTTSIGVGLDMGYAYNRRAQLAITMGNELYFRGAAQEPTDAAGWKKTWHDGNFDPATKQDVSTVVTVSASRGLTLADAGKYLRPNNATAIVLTVPSNAGVAFPLNTEITIRASGAGNVVLGAASGVTLYAPSGGSLTLSNNMTVTLKKVSTNLWDVIGQTVAA